MPRLSVDAQLARIQKQKALLEKKEQLLKSKAENKDLSKIIALIKKAGLSASDIAKAMKGGRGRRKGSTSKLAGKKIPPKYRNPLINRRLGPAGAKCRFGRPSCSSWVNWKKP